MTEHAWVKEFPGKIEVCDKDGILLEMNDKAAAQENNPAPDRDEHPRLPPRAGTDQAEGLTRERPGEYLHHREEGRQEADLPGTLVPGWGVCRDRRVEPGDPVGYAAFCEGLD